MSRVVIRDVPRTEFASIEHIRRGDDLLPPLNESAERRRRGTARVSQSGRRRNRRLDGTESPRSEIDGKSFSFAAQADRSLFVIERTKPGFWIMAPTDLTAPRLPDDRVSTIVERLHRRSGAVPVGSLNVKIPADLSETGGDRFVLARLAGRKNIFATSSRRDPF